VTNFDVPHFIRNRGAFNLAFSNALRKLEIFTFDFSNVTRKLGGVNDNFAQTSMIHYREAANQIQANCVQRCPRMTNFDV
jgi:hypothetical protein